MQTSPPKLCYFGHHKAGTKWLLKIIGHACSLLDLKLLHSHEPDFGGDEITGYDFIACSNANMKTLDLLPSYRGFHVIRDPRDVCVSAYFSHLNSHSMGGWPELSAHREKLKQCSVSEGLILDMDFTAELIVQGNAISYFSELSNWNYDNNNILELKFEDLIRDEYRSIYEIFRFLGLAKGVMTLGESIKFSSYLLKKHFLNKKNISAPFRCSNLPVEIIMRIVWKNNFENLTEGRSHGREKTTSHFRKGIAGDWVNYFDENVKKAFKDRFGDLVIKLGYENDANW